MNTSRYDVYLAGAMTGRNTELVLSEREEAKKLLAAYGLTCYDPAADENLEKVSTDGSINNSFDRTRMEWYVKKDMNAVSNSRCVLNITGDILSDGVAWEMGFAVYHRFIPVFLIAPKRVSGEKMGFTNILVDGMYNTLQEAVFAVNEELEKGESLMPYITQGERSSLEDGRVATKPGELNYKMSQLIKSYLAMNGTSYTHLNAIAGVLSCLSMEVYRRITARYEDEKLIENGDVFK